MAPERHEERLGRMLYAHLQREWDYEGVGSFFYGYENGNQNVIRVFERAAVSFLAHAREDNVEEKT